MRTYQGWFFVVIRHFLALWYGLQVCNLPLQKSSKFSQLTNSHFQILNSWNLKPAKSHQIQEPIALFPTTQILTHHYSYQHLNSEFPSAYLQPGQLKAPQTPDRANSHQNAAFLIILVECAPPWFHLTASCYTAWFQWLSALVLL